MSCPKILRITEYDTLIDYVLVTNIMQGALVIEAVEVEQEGVEHPEELVVEEDEGHREVAEV